MCAVPADLKPCVLYLARQCACNVFLVCFSRYDYAAMLQLSFPIQVSMPTLLERSQQPETSCFVPARPLTTLCGCKRPSAASRTVSEGQGVQPPLKVTHVIPSIRELLLSNRVHASRRPERPQTH